MDPLRPNSPAPATGLPASSSPGSGEVADLSGRASRLAPDPLASPHPPASVPALVGLHAAAALRVDIGPATAVNMSRLPSNPSELQADLRAANTRPVDTEQAASVINAVRRFALAPHHKDTVEAAASHKDLTAGISEELVDKWVQAQGLQPADYEVMKRAAFVSGLANPTGTDFMNAVSYVAAPVASALSGHAWAGAAVGLAAAAAAPAVNAYCQSGVVTRCDIYRERNGPTVGLNKADINDNISLPEVADKVASHTEAFSAACTAFKAAVDEQPGVQVTADGKIEGDLDAAQRQRLGGLAEKVLSTCDSMCDAQKQALMTQGSHARQEVGNATQVLPRTLRPLAAGLPGFGTGASTAEAAEAGGRIAAYSAKTAAGIQSGLAVAVAFAHHFTAGRDERNKQVYNNKLNMLYADIVTDAGKAKLGRGEEVSGGEIDEGKLRKLISSPAQAFVARVADTVKDQKTKVDARLTQIDPQWNDAVPMALANPSLTAAEHSELLQLRDKSQAMGRDIAHLKAGNIDLIPEGSDAHHLVTEGLKSFRSPLLGAALDKKYSTPGEFSSQAIQRLGQAFHLGVFGSAAASTVGRVASTVVGGTSHASSAQVGGVTAASGAMAFIGASYQYVAISEKNNRRADPSNVSAGQQLWRGVTALPRETMGMHASSAAIKQSNTVINSALQTIAEARSTVASLPPVEHEVRSAAEV